MEKSEKIWNNIKVGVYTVHFRLSGHKFFEYFQFPDYWMRKWSKRKIKEIVMFRIKFNDLTSSNNIFKSFVQSFYEEK